MRNLLIGAAVLCAALALWLGGSGVTILSDHPDTARSIVAAVYLAGSTVAVVGAFGVVAAVAILDAVGANTEATKPPPRMLT